MAAGGNWGGKRAVVDLDRTCGSGGFALVFDGAVLPSPYHCADASVTAHAIHKRQRLLGAVYLLRGGQGRGSTRPRDILLGPGSGQWPQSKTPVCSSWCCVALANALVAQARRPLIHRGSILAAAEVLNPVRE